MIPNYQPIPPKPRKVSRLPQLTKANRRMKKYYAEARRREVQVVN